jgi:hypothetical protein
MDVGINIINLIISPEKYTTLTLKKKTNSAHENTMHFNNFLFFFFFLVLKGFSNVVINIFFNFILK